MNKVQFSPIASHYEKRIIFSALIYVKKVRELLLSSKDMIKYFTVVAPHLISLFSVLNLLL